MAPTAVNTATAFAERRRATVDRVGSGDRRPLRVDYLHTPLPQRCGPRQPQFEVMMDRHAEALIAGAPAYLDPLTGRAVFTARFLADRGYCCDSGCRHCPYEPVHR